MGFAPIMHYPLSATHCKGMILGYLQIVHRPGATHNLPARNHAVLVHQHAAHAFPVSGEPLAESLFLREERMLLVGMNDLTGLADGHTVRDVIVGRERQIDEIVILVDPDV